MKKDGSVKVISILALVVCILGLSVGFAAYSSTVNIELSPTVKPDKSTFKVEFSSKDSASINNVSNEINPVVNSSEVKANSILASGNNISGLSAEFTEPGQSATYTFYAYNGGEYDAFLNSIAFSNASDSNSIRRCVSSTGILDSSVQRACQGISVSIKVGKEAFTKSSLANISNHLLPVNSAEQITVVIQYEKGSFETNKPFTVYFGDITLAYSSVD